MHVNLHVSLTLHKSPLYVHFYKPFNLKLGYGIATLIGMITITSRVSYSDVDFRIKTMKKIIINA